MSALAMAAAALVAFLVLDTQVDLAVSHWFYRPGDGFFHAGDPIIRFLYEVVPVVTCVTVALVAALACVRSLADRGLCKPPFSPPSWRGLFFVLALLVLGPGLVVNVACKEGFPRPRPREVREFGGTATYVRPFGFGGAGGASFGSGHAAIGFFLAGASLLIRRRRVRAACYAAGLVAGLGIGVARIAQGAHFLSDVVVAGLAVLWVAHGLFGAMFGGSSPRPPGET